MGAAGEAVPTYAAQPLRYWQDLLAQHLGKDSDADKEQCRRAAQALGQLGSAAKTAVPLLVQAIQSPSLEVRGFAVDSLGRIGSDARAGVSAIVAEVDLPPEHINYAPLAPFRRLAAGALGRIGPDAAAAVPVLEKALQNEDPLYRIQAALALWKISRHPQAIPALEAALKLDDPEAPFQAALALAAIGAEAKVAGPALVAALGHDDADVRRAAGRAVAGLGPSQMGLVAQRLTGGGIASPAAAAYVLGEMLDSLRPRVFYHPQMDLATAARQEVRLAAGGWSACSLIPTWKFDRRLCGSLAQMGLLAAPFLLQNLQADVTAARPAAIEALTRLEGYLPEASLEALMRLGYLPEASLASPCMQAVRASLIPRLLELIKHTDPQVRRAAYRAFAKFSLGPEGKAAVPLLRNALRDEDLSIRRHAFETLQQLGEK